MRYLGGKTRFRREILNAILRRKDTDSQTIKRSVNIGGGGIFVSLFCGGLSVECAVVETGAFEQVIVNDKHPYLIALYRALKDGWTPPEEVTEEEYRYVRTHLDENPALSGFVGFGCSFGGKWFAGYARAQKQQFYSLESYNSLMRQLPYIRKMEFLCLDYRDVDVPDGSTVYADPPYAEGTKYTFGINRKEFWDYMRELHRRGNRVFISEENAPEDFLCVWEKEIKRTLDNVGGNYRIRTERLFTLE